jgi:hypothetical protein
MKDSNIDKIVTQTQRSVKGFSQEDKLDLDDSNDLNWVSNFLSAPKKERVLNQQPEPELRWAVREMDRRITEQDFRERFPVASSKETKSRTEGSFKKALRAFTRAYTRSLKLVK